MAERKKVIDAINKTQRFNALDYPDYIDLVDFANQLASANIQSIDPQIISEFVAAAQDFIVINKTTKNSPFPKASGISAWLPLDETLFEKYFKRYQGLKFTLVTRWDKALTRVIGRV